MNLDTFSVFLLTPLREGRLGLGKLSGKYYIISTHAPAGGATTVPPTVVPPVVISTHAPAGGATL